MKQNTRKRQSKGKIKNATKIVYDNIQFKSKLEAYTYQHFKENNIQADYEPFSFTLIDKFEYNGEKVRAMTYKPDFVAKDRSFVVECKGFANESFPLRWKIFKYSLRKKYGGQGPALYVVKNQKQVQELITILKNDTTNN